MIHDGYLNLSFIYIIFNLATFFLGHKDIPNHPSFKKQDTQCLALILYLCIFSHEMEVPYGRNCSSGKLLDSSPLLCPYHHETKEVKE